MMITANLFTSSRHSQSIIEALKKAKKIKLANIYQNLNKIEAADVFIVAEFGQIINAEILNLPRYGSLCLHPSLLPKYRGASPVQYAIMNGERETGTTIFLMDEKIDHGPIIAQFKEKIKNSDTAETLYQRLFKKGAKMLIKVLPKYINYRQQKLAFARKSFETKNLKFKIFLPPMPQNHSRASYTPRLRRDDGFIPSIILKAAINGQKLPLHQQLQSHLNKLFDHLTIQPSNDILFLERFIRAMAVWPGAWTFFRSPNRRAVEKRPKRLKILKAHLEPLLKLPDRKLILDLVQIEGKKPTSWQQFLAGHHLN